MGNLCRAVSEAISEDRTTIMWAAIGLQGHEAGQKESDERYIYETVSDSRHNSGIASRDGSDDSAGLRMPASHSADFKQGDERKNLHRSQRDIYPHGHSASHLQHKQSFMAIILPGGKGHDTVQLLIMFLGL